MIFFRVTQNINIKTTDGTLVKYDKFKMPSNLNNDSVYITTYSDFLELKKVFGNVDKNKYHTRFIKEERVRALEEFPIELGISNANEYLEYEGFKKEIKNTFNNDEEEVSSFLQSNEKVDISKQLKPMDKDEVSIAIIGSVGNSISEMIASSTALRILYNKLNEVYKKVKMNLYIDASNNTFYSRDKQIYGNQSFITRVLPLSLSVKTLCTYDYFIDNSSVSQKSSYYKELNCVDAWLYKFGIDYTKIDDSLKYNELSLSKHTASESLVNKIKEAKKKGKLLLYHPYSANIDKSIPQTAAVKILKKLVNKAEGYVVVTTLAIDPKLKDDNLIDLSKESKFFNDLAYIVSSVDALISTDTAIYHIADAFMIPSIVIFSKPEMIKNIKYYKHTKAVEVKDKSVNYSKFIFENDSLTFYKFDSWQKLKIKRIIELLESF